MVVPPQASPAPVRDAPAPAAPAGDPPAWGSGVRPTSIAASSAYFVGRESHPAVDAFDGDLATAWNDGVEGEGRGQWIEATFDNPQQILGFRITLGYQYVSRRGTDLFTANARIRTLRVLGDGREIGRWSASDGQRDLFVTGLDITARAYRFEVIDVWPGARFQDVCVSEVAFVGPPGSNQPAARSVAERCRPVVVGEWSREEAPCRRQECRELLRANPNISSIDLSEEVGLNCTHGDTGFMQEGE